MQPEEVKRLIEAGIENCEAFVEGDGAHFRAFVVSPVFSGKSRVQKQQIVNDTVRAQLLDGSLHALSIKTFTPEEWDALDPEGEK
jgi:acid stress-induced BolA-like protein IbaG/YrbA